jgi:hypothetical protein
MTNMDNMADITNPSAGTWYQPITANRRILPRVYSNPIGMADYIRVATSGLGTEASTAGRGVIFFAGLAALAGLAWYVWPRG